jgi:hypothetical protein
MSIIEVRYMNTEMETAMTVIDSLIKTNRNSAIQTLLIVYNGQVEGEKDGFTVYSNGTGFNSRDAKFGCSVAGQFEETGWMSDRQLAVVRRMVRKYWRQVYAFYKDDLGPFTEDPMIIKDHFDIVREFESGAQ